MAVEPTSAKVVRGVVLAVAMDWQVRLKDGPEKEAALTRLAEAVELAAAACAD